MLTTVTNIMPHDLLATGIEPNTYLSYIFNLDVFYDGGQRLFVQHMRAWPDSLTQSRWTPTSSL